MISDPGLTHVVTLLIADVRNASREPDHQLAEVRVPLKKVDELEEGWWADARDIVGITLCHHFITTFATFFVCILPG
jgi:hypothetical protein